MKSSAKVSIENLCKAPLLTRELLDLASDMRGAGIIDAAAHEKVTLRHLGPDQASIVPVTSAEVKDMRVKARMSQAVFAHHLNLSVGYVSQLERGGKRAAGAALALVDVIRRKGIDAIL